MTLPPEVLRLLGDDATPEKVADGFDRLSKQEADAAVDPALHDFHELHAGAAYDYALCAAAIRAMEATIARQNAREGVDDVEALTSAEVNAVNDYDALRNWRHQMACAACGHLKMLHFDGDGCAFPVLYDADEPEPPPCGCKEFKP